MNHGPHSIFSQAKQREHQQHPDPVHHEAAGNHGLHHGEHHGQASAIQNCLHGTYVRWKLRNRCAPKQQSLLFDILKAFNEIKSSHKSHRHFSQNFTSLGSTAPPPICLGLMWIVICPDEALSS